MSRRTNNQNAWEGELNAQLNPGVLSVDLISTTGITEPMYVALAPEDPTIEVVKIIDIVGNTITFEARNLEGSSGDNTHPVGTKVRAVFTKQLQDDLFDDIEDLELADTQHEAAADPHAGYILEANHGSSGDPHTQYLKESDFTKAAIDLLGIDAETLDGIDSTGFSVAGHTHPTGTHDHDSDYAPISHVGSNGSAHADVTVSTDGFMTASDKQKLDGIESNAEVNPTANELLTSIKTVDGSGSGLDADTVDGVQYIDIVDNNTDFQVFTRSGNVAIGAGWTAHHSCIWLRPAGWNSAKLLVEASSVYTNGAASNDVFGRINSSVGSFAGQFGPLNSSDSGLTLVGFAEYSTVSVAALTLEVNSYRTGTQATAISTMWKIIAVRLS